jgi:hypothetical protein
LLKQKINGYRDFKAVTRRNSAKPLQKGNSSSSSLQKEVEGFDRANFFVEVIRKSETNGLCYNIV